MTALQTPADRSVSLVSAIRAAAREHYDVRSDRAPIPRRSRPPAAVERAWFAGVDFRGQVARDRRVGHRFALRGSAAFGDVESEREKLAASEPARTIDTLGARARESCPNDLLLVVSAFGMEPLARQTVLRSSWAPTATHERAPDGFVLAFARTSRRAGRRASVVDLAPTICIFQAAWPRYGWVCAD
jgi:hypothetical protein